jgi:restriction endonuclease S subunit
MTQSRIKYSKIKNCKKDAIIQRVFQKYQVKFLITFTNFKILFDRNDVTIRRVPLIGSHHLRWQFDYRRKGR